MRPAFVADVDRFADATRYRIDLRVDLDELVLQGTEQVRYTNHETATLTEIAFRLLPNLPGYGGSLTVRSVTLNGTPATPRLEFEGSALYVPLASPLAPGGMVDLTLEFEGRIPVGSTSSGQPLPGYAQYGYIDGVLALPNAYPMIPVYDDEGWNVEVAPTYGDATFTDTSLYWLQITAPADMTMAASGVEVARQDRGDGTVTHTFASGPMRDVNIVASTAYKTAQTTVDQVRVTSYYLPGDEAGGERALDYAARALAIYKDLISPYPFTELDVMATPTQAGGIEYPGLIVIAQSLYGQTGGFFEVATVHETAHQWWYSLVGNDQLDEPWLDEALAQYTSLLYLERRYGSEAAQSVLGARFDSTYQRLRDNGLDMPVGLPVAAYSEELYGAVVYYKGPLFFRALRQQVKDQRFDAILRAYFRAYCYGVAYPQDLLSTAERVSGQELDGLYEEWILGK
jgi:aminopeptidase N